MVSAEMLVSSVSVSVFVLRAGWDVLGADVLGADVLGWDVDVLGADVLGAGLFVGCEEEDMAVVFL